MVGCSIVESHLYYMLGKEEAWNLQGVDIQEVVVAPDHPVNSLKFVRKCVFTNIFLDLHLCIDLSIDSYDDKILPSKSYLSYLG